MPSRISVIPSKQIKIDILFRWQRAMIKPDDERTVMIQ